MHLTYKDLELLGKADEPAGYEADNAERDSAYLLVGQGYLAQCPDGTFKTTREGRERWLDWVSERPADGAMP